MSRPFLEEIKQYSDTVEVFSGLDRRPRASEGRFADMKNMSARKYPLAATRLQRKVWASGGSYTAIIAKEKLCYVNNGVFYVGQDPIDIELDPLTQKELISFGAYVIIMPDKKYVNTNDYTDSGDIDASFTDTVHTVTVRPCADAEGTTYTVSAFGSEAPADPDDGDVWQDNSGANAVLREYSAKSGEWNAVASSYVRIECGEATTGEFAIGASFSAGDGVTISGITSSLLKSLNGVAVISAIGSDGVYIVIPGDVGGNVVSFTGITVERRMPLTDYIVESGNRLWGCRYGENVNGDWVNEIYATKLGDFKNWNVFSGISTDSYVASLGSDGNFTGAVSYRGYPHFFKEKRLHKVLGTQPSNFQVSSTELDGVSSLCDRSLAVCGDVLFYKSRTSVVAYDGSFPTDVGAALGLGWSAGEAVAGAVGELYYVSMGNDLYCYDTSKGVWSREDGGGIKQFAELRGRLYCMKESEIVCINDTNPDEGSFEWMVETGELGIGTPEKKYITRLAIRMRLDVMARLTVYVSYDSGGAWEALYHAEGGKMRNYNVTVRPKRCDHLRLRIEGEGECEIYSITKYTEYGSVL